MCVHVHCLRFYTRLCLIPGVLFPFWLPALFLGLILCYQKRLDEKVFEEAALFVFNFYSGFLTLAKKLGLSTPELENYNCSVFSHATVVQ
jgi:hypothetical protein